MSNISYSKCSKGLFFCRGWELADFVTDGEWSPSHLYDIIPGDLNITIRVYNENFEQTFHCDIYVLNTPEGLILQSNSPQPYDQFSGTHVAFHFEMEPGMFPPLVANVTFTFDNDDNSTLSDVFTMEQMHYGYRYMTAGKRNVTVTIVNKLGALNVTHLVDIARPVEGLQMNVIPCKFCKEI